MPRMPRKGMTYFGVDLPDEDLAIVREVAKEADRPAGYVLRKILSAWIDSDPKLVKRRAALKADLERSTPGKRTGTAGRRLA